MDSGTSAKGERVPAKGGYRALSAGAQLGFRVRDGPLVQTGDEACRELLELHITLVGAPEDEAAFFTQMVQARRLVIRLRVRRLYGLVLERPPDT